MKNQLEAIKSNLPTRPATVELVNIAVKEDQHGKGLGKQLVMDAIRVAKSKGYT